MSTEIFIAELMKNFIAKLNNFYTQVENEFKEYSKDPNNKALLKNLKKKYPYLKRYKINKRSKIQNCKALIYELFEQDEFNNIFSKDERNTIYKYCISKIRGLYKHAQALKTGFCNGQIITAFSESNTISICITKNTLEANEQWLQRLCKELDDRYPKIKLDDKLMIISSKKNTLDGNATHCKNANDAWSYLKKPNDFKIIFICSNKIRIQDIYEMAASFLNLKEELVKKLRILHDEGHNIKEGIPPYRYIIENILLLENVLSYQPISATIGEIVDDTNPIWNKQNLEKYAINFSNFDNTKSDDPKYSSISDYKKINFEDLKTNCHWKNYNVYSASREEFIHIYYKGKNLINLSDSEKEDIEKDIEKRRQFEFCDFMKNDHEIEAYNNGLNILNLNNILSYNYFIPDELNLHIISTPGRKLVTYKLCLEASKKDYNPIVLGIYGNQGDKYHLFINNNESCVDNIMEGGEFNNKLDKLINYLNLEKYNTNRPFIIIGNYTPTGESLSYVNYKYGTVRGVIRLISTNAEEDYQSACRGNYMTTKFLENNSEWVQPDKYLIGPEKFIKNAESYERENDARIDDFNRLNDNANLTDIILPSINSSSANNVNGKTAIPIKITVDSDDKNYEELIKIADKKRRTSKDKKEFMKLLKESVDNPESYFEINDITGKFIWEDMTLKDFRSYRKDTTKVKIGNWKFKNYQSHFKTETPLINNTSNHKAYECEVLVCRDNYIIKNENEKVVEKHSKYTWWIGYKY